MKTIIGILLFLSLFGLLLYGAAKSSMSVDRGELQARCLSDVQTAQETALEKLCTQQFKMLVCPHDESVTYEAPNGCEISFLEARGWR